MSKDAARAAGAQRPAHPDLRLRPPGHPDRTSSTAASWRRWSSSPRSGLKPYVSTLKCGHSYYVAGGGMVSEHTYGDAVDIAMVNGIPIVGHQGPGSITDITMRRLLTLQGTMQPNQIISLMTYPGVVLRLGAERPRRPHPRRLPAAVRRQRQARAAYDSRAQARPVGQADRPAQPDRQPGRPHEAVEVRDTGGALGSPSR